MSVLISGMEMPTSCSDCPMCYDMMECTVGMPRIGFWKNEMKAEPFDFCTERHPRCPLVPVPKRGRLIDADAAIENRNSPINWCYDLCDLPDYLADCPTIIPDER